MTTSARSHAFQLSRLIARRADTGMIGRGIGEIADRLLSTLRIEIIQDGCEIHLGQQHKIGGPEHHRIFGRLVVAFGRRQKNDVAMLPEIERRRADEVANVLDENDVQF